jgi:hypothetical protein
MVSFNKMHGFCYEFYASCSDTVCYCIIADQSLSLLFIVGWFCFCRFFFINIGSHQKEKYSSCVSFFIKSTLILKFMKKSNHNYRTKLQLGHTPYYWGKSLARNLESLMVFKPACRDSLEINHCLLSISFGKIRGLNLPPFEIRCTWPPSLMKKGA